MSPMDRLRAKMVAAAERHPLPARFEAEPEAGPCGLVVLRDRETGRESRVGYTDYPAVRKSLGELFG